MPSRQGAIETPREAKLEYYYVGELKMSTKDEGILGKETERTHLEEDSCKKG